VVVGVNRSHAGTVQYFGDVPGSFQDTPPVSAPPIPGL
jgi:hypothetical protein